MAVGLYYGKRSASTKQRDVGLGKFFKLGGISLEPLGRIVHH
jgi:hypothetical protein